MSEQLFEMIFLCTNWRRRSFATGLSTTLINLLPRTDLPRPEMACGSDVVLETKVLVSRRLEDKK